MKNRNVVKQDHKLINAKYKLNNSEIKFILIAIAQIDKDDDELKEYEIKVSELEEKFQTKQNETILKQFAKKLLAKPLEVPTENGWVVLNWFADIEYVRGQAKFKVSISKKLKPYLLNLKERFVKYNLKYILPLTSNYSIRIYQLLKEYEKIGNRTFAVEELQNILKVPNSLKRYDNFKRKVILIAQKELQEKTDIYFDFEEIKTGRKVTHIKFLIFENPKNKKLSLPEQESPLKQEKEPIKPKSPNKTLSPLEQLKAEVKNGLPYIQFKRKLMNIQNTDIANYLEGYQPYMLLRTDDIGHLELYNQKTKKIIELDAIKDQERLENLRKYLYKNPDRIGDVKEINGEEMLLNDLKSKLLNRYDTFKLKNGLHYCVQIKSVELKDDKVKISGDDIIEGIKDMSITWDLKDIDKYITGLKDSVDRDLIEHYKILNISTKKNIIKEKIKQLNIYELLEVAEFLDNKSIELSEQYVKYEKESNQEKMKEIRKKVEALNKATFNLVDFTEGSIEEVDLDLFIKEPVFRLIINKSL